MSKLILTVTLLTSAAVCDPRPVVDLVEQQGGVLCAKIRDTLSIARIAPPLAPIAR